MLLFGPTYASSIVNSTLGLNAFLVDKPIASTMYELAFITGQPLGYYGPWSPFSLSRHYLVWLAAQHAQPNRDAPFTDYAILGDDVIIASDSIASQHTKLLAKLSIQISYSKSRISKSGAVEFANKFWVKEMQVDLSPVSLKSLLCCRSTIGLC